MHTHTLLYRYRYICIYIYILGITYVLHMYKDIAEKRSADLPELLDCVRRTIIMILVRIIRVITLMIVI